MTIIGDRILPLRRALMSLAIHFFLATRVCVCIHRRGLRSADSALRREGHSDTGKKDDHTRRLTLELAEGINLV